MESKVTSELLAALCAAQSALRTLGRDRANEQQRFRYVSAEKIIGAASEVLGRNGLVVVRLASELGEWVEQTLAGRSGSSTYVVADVRNVFAVLHAGSCGALVMEYTVPAVQSAGRPADKAKFAADTEALGYALRDLLLVARGDEDDVAGRDDSEPEPRQEAQRAPSPLVGITTGVPEGLASLDAYAACKGQPNGFAALVESIPVAQHGALARAIRERVEAGNKFGWLPTLKDAAVGHERACEAAKARLASAGHTATSASGQVGLALYLLGLGGES